MIDKQTFIQTLLEIDDSLRFLAANGWSGFDCSSQTLAKLANWGQGPQLFIETLEDIRTDLGDCQRCRLAQGRNCIVFGDGNFHATTMQGKIPESVQFDFGFHQ